MTMNIYGSRIMHPKQFYKILKSLSEILSFLFSINKEKIMFFLIFLQIFYESL